MGTMTKKGAQAVTGDLDRIASLFQQDWETLGVPQHIANDFALRCDKLADYVEARSGIKREALTEYDPVKEPGFNPEEIGEGKAGPLEDEPDEPFMKGEFSQQENRELRELEQSGNLPAVQTAPAAPRPGVQAAMVELAKAAKGVENPAVEKAVRLALTVVEAAKAEEDEDEDKGEDKKASDHGYKLDA